MKLKKRIVLLIILFMVLLLGVLYVVYYPYASADSEDGQWTAYLISTERDGIELADGLCNGVLVYQGNRKGEAEKVRIKVECDGKKYSGWEKAVQHHRSTSGNLSTIIERILVRKDSFYWFAEFMQFSDYDSIKIDIRWKDANQRERGSSIELNVKEAREKSIPIRQF